MRIAIDARFLGTGTGIGRYVEQLIFNLEKIVEDSDQRSRAKSRDRSGENLENEYFILISKEVEDKYNFQNSN